jgi:hypothetical protein
MAPASSAGGGGAQTPAPTVEGLQAENAQLRARIVELEGQQKENAEVEKVVREKMGIGLSREQALAVIRRQKEHDAAKAKAAEAKKTAQANKGQPAPGAAGK